MTTTISPSAGQGILYTQQGAGSTPGYAALDERRSNFGSLQEGVYGTSTPVTAGGVSSVANADFMVTQRNAGANMSVDINMPAGGFALVQGDTISGQGLYTVPVHNANINETIAAADPTNPRVDQIILEVQDNVLDASGGNQARTRVLTGVPQAGANLTNRTGALALPGSALLLADVLVGNGVSSLANSVMRDRRKWARGAYRWVQRTAGNVSITSTSGQAIDSTTLAARVECSGVPMRLSLVGGWQHATASANIAVAPLFDGAQGGARQDTIAVTGNGQPFNAEYEVSLAAGSHTLDWNAFVSAGTGTILATSTIPLIFVFEELVRQTTANNTVTTG